MLGLIFLVCHLYEVGLPTSGAVIEHTAYTLKYCEKHEQAEWVAYKLTKATVKGKFKRTDDFRPDPLVKTGSATLKDYVGSGYDRGHLAPAADMNWSAIIMSESFFMSNMSPQKPRFNRGIWKKLEAKVRTWAISEEEIYVVTGPILEDNLPTIGRNKVSIPKYYYKVILDYKKPELKGIGFVLANKSSSAHIKTFAVTIDSIEVLTGINFFPKISEEIEANVDITKWEGIK